MQCVDSMLCTFTYYETSRIIVAIMVSEHFSIVVNAEALVLDHA